MGHETVGALAATMGFPSEFVSKRRHISSDRFNEEWAYNGFFFQAVVKGQLESQQIDGSAMQVRDTKAILRRHGNTHVKHMSTRMPAHSTVIPLAATRRH